jgi:2,3-bisphosphoglycerate-independent phosphoglycerate mutase
MSTLLLFIDGIGVGSDDSSRNPFGVPGIRHLAPLAGRAPSDGAAFRPLDATLGVSGLPQSATGQTTLFTGVNAARTIGRHHPGLPGPTLQAILRAESLFSKLVSRGLRPTFANAFTARYLESKRPRFGATTHMVMASGVRLRTLEEDDARDSALSHEYTGTWMSRRGFPSRPRTPDDAAAVLSGLLEEHDLVLYEYFLTDLAGHRGTRDERFHQALHVEALVGAVLKAADPSRHRVVLVSDHGNLEESDHDRHTTNPAPLFAWGRAAEEFVARVDAMDELTPALVEEDRSSR